MRLDRLWFHSAKSRLWRWLQDEIVHAPVEAILHPSRYRLLWIGMFTFFGHLIAAVVWAEWVPQPYENYAVRALMALLSVAYVMPDMLREPMSRSSGRIFGLATWIQLPFFFSWMYCMNGGNAAWLASVSAMVLIYYHATDWRLATLGLLTGAPAGYLLAHALQGPALVFVNPGVDVVAIAFAWVMGLMLGFSSANLRRTRLLNTLSTMGVMAHELRTPLATVNLLGDVVRNLVQHDVPEAKRKRIEELAGRLQGLVRSMNQQIDTQISNAQLYRLPRHQSLIHAADLVHETVQQYPYRSSRERDCVRVHIQQDFCFQGSRALFGQVLSNLLKNALHSLASASSAPSPGDLRIEVGLHHGKGRIAVSDDGVGIPGDLHRRIFEPFFSTQSGAGSGLGLTFCKNVVEAANGTLSVHSEISRGAVFMIDLPLNAAPTNRTAAPD
ncbi:MAG: HAMP domain-containing histidine kinase [Hydrogenophaga sp.]|nr:HAMP domain-containing histidine kinase [Hydrogenophaga sp.]